MTYDEIILECTRRVSQGKGYLDISEYLKECKVDEETRKKVFEELGREKLKTEPRKLKVAYERLILAVPAIGYATYLLFTMQFSPKSISWVILILVVGLVVSSVEIAKLFANIFRKQ